MLLFEAFFKFANIGVFMVLVALIIKSKQRSLLTTLMLLLLISFSCFLLTTGAESLRLNGTIAIPLRIVDTISVACVWLLGLLLFDDHFKPRRVHLWVVGIYLYLMLVIRLTQTGIQLPWSAAVDINHFGLLVSTLSFGMMAHLAWVAIKGRRDDLLESRRTARIWLVVALIAIISCSILLERTAFLFAWQRGFDLALYVNYVFVLPVSIFFTLWAANLDTQALSFQRKTNPDLSASSVESKYQSVYLRLTQLMKENRAYAEHGLTIGSLAKTLDLPEHQLRELINQTMKYSNFSSFLNHYRVNEVKQALADPELARTPILTLALEAGFASLAPFNRAFKSEVGVTPTEYRQKIMDKSTTKTAPKAD